MAAFKSVNSVLFIVLGAIVMAQILRVAGMRVEALPGAVLGAAMIALGLYRTFGSRRAP